MMAAVLTLALALAEPVDDKAEAPCLTALDALTSIVEVINTEAHNTALEAVRYKITRDEVVDRFQSYGIRLDVGLQNLDDMCLEYKTPGMKHYRESITAFAANLAKTLRTVLMIYDIRPQTNLR